MTASDMNDGIATGVSALDARGYRDLMREMTGAVTIIAAGRAGDRSGLTATAVCSLSDQPPTVLACINRGSATFDVIARERCFSVNVLGGDMRALAEQFAGRGGATGEGKFAAGAWTTLATGAPALIGSLATLDCTVVEMPDVATHAVVIGRVVAGTHGAGGPVLLYARGAYWAAALE